MAEWGTFYTLHPQVVLIVVVQSLSHIRLFATPWTAAHQLLCPPLSPGVCFNQSPFSSWCFLTISSPAVPFSCCLQSFPESRSFPMSQLFISGGQSRGTSASVFPMNAQDWFPLGLTDLISLHPQYDFYYFLHIRWYFPDYLENSYFKIWCDCLICADYCTFLSRFN